MISVTSLTIPKVLDLCWAQLMRSTRPAIDNPDIDDPVHYYILPHTSPLDIVRIWFFMNLPPRHTHAFADGSASCAQKIYSRLDPYQIYFRVSRKSSKLSRRPVLCGGKTLTTCQRIVTLAFAGAHHMFRPLCAPAPLSVRRQAKYDMTACQVRGLGIAPSIKGTLVRLAMYPSKCLTPHGHGESPDCRTLARERPGARRRTKLIKNPPESSNLCCLPLLARPSHDSSITPWTEDPRLLFEYE